jgi:hypothetical protein
MKSRGLKFVEIDEKHIEIFYTNNKKIGRISLMSGYKTMVYKLNLESGLWIGSTILSDICDKVKELNALSKIVARNISEDRKFREDALGDLYVG